MTRPSSTPDQPPPDIPEHRLLALIARGSYGQVWLAENPLGQRRAVKIVRREWFRDTPNYEREYRGIEQFEPVSRNHPALINLLQLGRNDEAGFYYCVMELADHALGQGNYQPATLRHRIDHDGRLPVAACIDLGTRLANGLAFLHDSGLVHRDIKPSNILYHDGQPCLGDIGTVAPTDEATSLVGTHGYIPLDGPGIPEADLYGLGKTLYEAFTGKDRFDYPALPDTFTDDGFTETHSQFNNILLKACAPKLERYKTAAQLAEDLAHLKAGRVPVHARQPRRRLAIAAALLATIIALAAWPSGKPLQSDEIKNVAANLPAGPWDFQHGFHHVHQPEAEQFLIEKTNVKKFTEWQNPPINYWGTAVHGKPAIINYHFTFDAPTSRIYLNVGALCYGKKGEAVEGRGAAAIEASRDGKQWVALAHDTPIMEKPVWGYDAAHHGLLPKKLTGSRELFIRIHLLTEGPEGLNYSTAQFARYKPMHTEFVEHQVFQIRASY